MERLEIAFVVPRRGAGRTVIPCSLSKSAFARFFIAHSQITRKIGASSRYSAVLSILEALNDVYPSIRRKSVATTNILLLDRANVPF